MERTKSSSCPVQADRCPCPRSFLRMFILLTCRRLERDCDIASVSLLLIVAIFDHIAQSSFVIDYYCV